MRYFAMGKLAHVFSALAFLLTGAAQAQVTKKDVAAARKFIEETQARYQRLPLGNVPKYLFGTLKAEFGWQQAEHIDICAALLAKSLKSAKSKAALAAEFQRIVRTYDGGVVPTYGDLAIRWGLADRFSAKDIDERIKDKADRRLFSTALLLDSVASVWFFMVGYEYYQRFAEQLRPEAGNEDSLTQGEVERRLRLLGTEANGASRADRISD